MGIDFSHGSASWSYSGFARFRGKIADQVGLKDYDSIESCDDPRFEVLKDDPIRFLLAHSDCDGELTVEQCAAIAPRLREVLSSFPDDNYDKKMGMALVEGLEEAVRVNEPMVFQ